MFCRHALRNLLMLPFAMILAGMTFSLPAAAQQPSSQSDPLYPIPDPSIIAVRDSKGYCIVCSGRGIPIWHSTDLLHWKQVGRIFEQDVPAWAKKWVPGSRGVWAPDLKCVGGLYYVYYSVSTLGSQRSVIGLAVNKTLDPTSPDYRWEDRGLILRSDPKHSTFNAIDPALLIDREGKGYLFWGSYWDGIKAGEVDLKTGRLLASPDRAVAVARRAARASRGIEGAYPIRHGKYYYLFVSWDHTFARRPEDISYKVMVGRATKPLGPYVDRQGVKMTDGGGELVVMGDQRWRGPGHNGVLLTADGSWLVHHVVDMHHVEARRVLQIRPLQWHHGWPVAGQPLGAAHMPPSDRRTQRVVGRWDHIVDGKVHYDIFLEGNGLLSGAAGLAHWRWDGAGLLLIWDSPKAPDGHWIDRVKLGPDGRTYHGTNQKGTPIEGRRRL